MGEGEGALLTSSPSKNERLSCSATYLATVDFPHAVGPVKNNTYRGRPSVGFVLSAMFCVEFSRDTCRKAALVRELDTIEVAGLL